MPAGRPWVNLPMVAEVSCSAASWGGVDGGKHKVFEHFFVFGGFGDELGADVDAADLVAAGHHDFDQAVARFAVHFGNGQLGLRFFHIFLHFLGLLHQAAQSCFSKHFGYSCMGLWVGLGLETFQTAFRGLVGRTVLSAGTRAPPWDDTPYVQAQICWLCRLFMCFQTASGFLSNKQALSVGRRVSLGRHTLRRGTNPLFYR